jgi:hypothetical protein
MTLDLHPEARRALTTALAEELAILEVEYNTFLVRRSTAGLTRLDSILPSSNSKIGQRIAAILGDEPFSDFVFDQVSIQLHERTFDGESTTIKLTSIEQFENATTVAEELVSQFDSLPWSYSLFDSIPYEIGLRLAAVMPENEFVLNEKYRLVRFDEHDVEYPPWPSRRETSFNAQEENRFRPDLLYFNGRMSGYVGLYLGLRPVEEFDLALRALFGIGIAERVIKPRYYHFAGDRQRSAAVFRRKHDAWVALSPQDLDSRTANLVHSIGPDQLLASRDDDAMARFTAKDFIHRARAAFEDNVVRDRLLGSAQWLFESYAETNLLLAFVQSMVALEILFGEKAASDIIGIGELLANRCAFSIAKNRAQRDEILLDFKRIYDTRSRIVHRGQSRLSRREETDLRILRWMVSRAIQEEIKLVMG